MVRWKRLMRAQKGAVLVEFGLSAVLLVFVLLSVLEFGMEIYGRTSTDRMANRMTEGYASTRDMDAVRSALDNSADKIVRRCVAGPTVYAFDSLVGVNPLEAGTGRLVEDDAPGAPAFRLELVCDWPRLTPFMASIVGNKDGYRSVRFARFRVGGGT